MSTSWRYASLTGLSLGLVAVVAAASTIKTAATITLTSGPNAGTHAIESVRPCAISPSDAAEPRGFGVTVETPGRGQSLIHAKPQELGAIEVNIPNIGRSHLGELQVSIVFGDPENRKTRGALYAIVTVPEGATQQVKELDELLKRGGAPRKRSGKGGATLADKGATATLTFWGETAAGVAFKGSIDCRRVSHE